MSAAGVPTRFTFDPLNDISPVWSPDGARIVFRSDRAGGNYMFEKLTSGAEAERLDSACGSGVSIRLVSGWKIHPLLHTGFDHGV